MKKSTLILALVMSSSIATSFGQANEMQEDIALIKKNLTDSKEKLKKYEWIETTTVSINGEQKTKKQYQCYYAVDGKLTKVETGASTPASTQGGIRGKIVENKKEELGDYIEKAMKIIEAYIPPQAEKIQKNYNDGKTGINVLEPGKKFKLNFQGYNQEGDLLSISLDRANKLLTAYSISTFVEEPTDKVSFDITLKTFPDGTQYPAEIAFNSPGKKLNIVMQNSGYKAGGGH